MGSSNKFVFLKRAGGWCKPVKTLVNPSLSSRVELGVGLCRFLNRYFNEWIGQGCSVNLGGNAGSSRPLYIRGWRAFFIVYFHYCRYFKEE